MGKIVDIFLAFKYCFTMDRHQLTAKYIDFLLAEKPYDSISLEYPFAHFKRKADILLLKDRLSIGIEIKGARDSLNSLYSQLLDYRKCFNAVDVLIDICHLPTVRDHMPSGCGLVVYSDDGFSRKISPKQRTRLDKWEVAGFFKNKELRQMLRDAGRDIKANDVLSLREEVYDKVKSSVLNSELATLLLKNTKDNFELFLNEKHLYTLSDDLLILSNRTK